MPKDRLEDYTVFYQEIPNSQDYLNEPDIADLPDDDHQPPTGLPTDQVSMLTADAHANVNGHSSSGSSTDGNPRLFSDQS